MKKITTWILVADGSRARIVVNDGPGRGVKREPVQEFLGPNAPSRGIASDRPGRTFDSGGPGRHAMEPPTDPHEHEQRTFLAEVAGFLDQAAKRGDFDRLVIVAPPRALGNLRAVLSEAARAKVTGQLNKDLTNVPIHGLADHLGAVLPV